MTTDPTNDPTGDRTGGTTLADTLRQKLDELELERRLGEAARAAEQAMIATLDAVSGYAKDHEDDVHRWLDKAGASFDERTGRRYADQVSQVKEQVRRGLAALAERS